MNDKKPEILNRRHQVLTAIILIAFFILIYFNIGTLTSVFNIVTISLQKPLNGAISNIEDFKSVFTQYEAILEENNTLKEENVSLLQEKTRLESMKEENTQLKKLLDYVQANSDYKYITAGIYAQDSINLSNTIIIDRGTSNGIKNEDHVILNGLYIGKIIEVTNNNAHVRLITSPGLSIVGQIPAINTSGIVQGQIGFGLTMKDIPPDAQLELGQVVTTAPIDSSMPEDLLLGEIIEIKHNDQDIFQEAILKPYFDLKQIKYVLVKISDK